MPKRQQGLEPLGLQRWVRDALEARNPIITDPDTQATVVLPAADLLNDRVVPFFDGFGIPLLRVLTDRRTEYCGNPEHHEYELYLAVENIDHTRTKAKSPQTNGIVERLHKTMLNEFYRIS
jgi:hypothetical protein